MVDAEGTLYAFRLFIQPSAGVPMNPVARSYPLFADTRCDEETMPAAFALRGAERAGSGATFEDIRAFPRNVENLLTIYRGRS